MSTMKNLDNLLFNPDFFFRNISKNKVSLKYPALIILINAIFATVSGVMTINAFMGNTEFSSTAQSFATITTLIVAAGAFIGVFLWWLILSGIFYAISYIFDSKGSFWKTLEFTGYGFVPQIASSFLNLIIMYKLLPSLDLSSVLTQNVRDIFSNNPLYYTSSIIGIVCLLLSANIWIYALLHARNLSIKSARLTVCIPIGIAILYQIYLLLF